MWKLKRYCIRFLLLPLQIATNEVVGNRIYSLTVAEAQSLESRCLLGGPLSTALGEILFLPLWSPGDCWCSLICDLITAISTCVVTLLYPLCCCSVTKSCLTPCDPMDCSTTGFLIFYYLLEFAQIPVCWVSDITSPSPPLPPLSPLALSFPASGSFPMNRLLASGGQSIGVSASASVLPMNIQGWFPLGLTGLISLQSKGLSRVLLSTTLWKHQFFSVQSSLWSNFHIYSYCL